MALLEVILSAGLLFLVMVILLNLATTSLWGTQEGGERLAAESYAAGILEEFRSKPFSSYLVELPLEQPPYLESGIHYRAVLTARSVGPGDTLRLLEVTVTWSTRRGSLQSTLATYATQLLR
jgi:hypothetical protein